MTAGLLKCYPHKLPQTRNKALSDPYAVLQFNSFVILGSKQVEAGNKKNKNKQNNNNKKKHAYLFPLDWIGTSRTGSFFIIFSGLHEQHCLGFEVLRKRTLAPMQES